MIRNSLRTLILVGAAFALLLADEPLKSALDLTMDQARVVDGIQKSYRSCGARWSAARATTKSSPAGKEGTRQKS